MIISYHPQGRLGNNIFQYIAVKVIQKYINDLYGSTIYTYVYNHKTNMFGELNFSMLYNMLKNINSSSTSQHAHSVIKSFCSSNWFFDGFYQFDYHIKDNLDYIRSLFTISNDERINDKYTVADIVKNVYDNKVEFNPDDIVTHVRLDDFYNTTTSMIIDHNYISQIIKTQSKIYNPKEKIGKVYVVVDKISKDYEIKYMDEFYKNTIFTTISNPDNMFKDLAYLWFAPNLICNNSTFCWIAYIFGDAKQTWCPKNIGLNYPQSFEKIKDDTIVYTWNTYK